MKYPHTLVTYDNRVVVFLPNFDPSSSEAEIIKASAPLIQTWYKDWMHEDLDGLDSDKLVVAPVGASGGVCWGAMLSPV